MPQTTTHQPHRAHTPVQNSPGTRHARPNRYKTLPATPTSRPQPVQNSPRTAKNARFRPFGASREKIIPVQTQTTRAGRTFFRSPPPTSHAAHTPRYKTLRAHGIQGHNRYKTLPATPTSRPNRYKTLPTQQKTPISTHSPRAGRKLSRSRHKQPEQGEHFSAAHHPLATQHTLPGTKLP